MKKIKVACIFKSSNIFLTGKHFDNTYFNFFMNALKRNTRLELTYFPTKQIFDASILKDKFDIILLWKNFDFGMPEEITGIQELDIPVIANVSDPIDAKRSIKYHKKWKIDYYYDFAHEDFFYETYPKYFKYKKILFGVETRLYNNLKPFNQRIKDRILLTGAIGNKKFFSKIINDIKRPKWNAYRFYNLRTKCSDLPYVDYTSTLQHHYVNDRYPELLEQYASSITATTYSPNIKYWENAAAGCLTFMEITKKNRGEYLGYEDGETAIFIDKDNYEEKFGAYLNDLSNDKWERIAKNGREFTLKNFNNDKAATELVDLMKKLI